MSSVRNVMPVGPGSVGFISQRWTRVRGRSGPISIQCPARSGVPWTAASAWGSLGPMYAMSSPRTSRYQRIALRRSETTIATVSMPRMAMDLPGRHPDGRQESAAPVSAVRRPVAVHLGVPLHDLVIGNPLDLLLDGEVVLGLPRIDGPPGRGVSLELRHDELPLPPAGLEGRHDLRSVEDDVARAHVELLVDRVADVQEEVVLRREDELAPELEAADPVEVFLHDPHHGALAAGEEALREPPFPLEFPEPLADLAHVVLEPRVGGEGFRRRDPEALEDPAEDLPAGIVPTDLGVRHRTVAVRRVAGDVQALVQLAERRRGCRSAEVREDEEPRAGDRGLLLDQLEDGPHVLREARAFRGLKEAEVLLRAVRPVLRDREAFRKQPVPLQPLEGTELPHAQAGREIRAQAAERLRRGDGIEEPGLRGDALPVEDAREEVAPVEIPRHDRAVGEEVGEAYEPRARPRGQVLDLRDVLRLEPRHAQHVDAAHRVERHHARQGADRL